MEPIVEHVAYQKFKALGHPLRLSIVEALAEKELTHKELQQATGNLQLSLWRLLEDLVDQNLVEKIEIDRRDVRYKTDSEALFWLSSVLLHLAELCGERDCSDE